jgi:hypothetical protein
MENKPLILVSSTDSYSDTWEPFFTLLKKNITNISDYRIYLLSDSKSYNGHSFVNNIQVSSNNEILSWSERILRALDTLNSEIIFLVFDDYFLMSKLNQVKFKEFYNIMCQNKNIANLRLVHEKKSFPSVYNDLNQVKNLIGYKNSLMPGFWRKEDLINLIQIGENPWQFELLGTIRTYFYPKMFYVVTEELSSKIYNFAFSGGIIKGKWVRDEYNKIKKITGLTLNTKRGFITWDPNKNKYLRKFTLIKNTLKNKKLIINSLIFMFNNILKRRIIKRLF